MIYVKIEKENQHTIINQTITWQFVKSHR